MKLLRGLATVLLLALAAPALAVSVAFINPGKHDEAYWVSATRAMQEAARQLDMQLEVHYAERDPSRPIALAQQILSRPQRPDYLIAVNEQAVGPEILRLANDARVPVLLAFSSLSADEVERLGEPRTRLRYWLGSLEPNTREVGSLLANTLYRSWKAAHPQRKRMRLLAVAGNKQTPAGVLRLQGLMDEVARNPAIELLQVVHGDWNRDIARQQMAWSWPRYPGIDAVWTANDQMAFGVLDYLASRQRRPGRDVMIASINTSADVLKARESGAISTLYGGHFLVGAFAMVMLYDHSRGRDFAPLGLRQTGRLFGEITAGDARRFLQRFGDDDYSSIPFRKASRALNPSRQRYSFTLDWVMKSSGAR